MFLESDHGKTYFMDQFLEVLALVALVAHITYLQTLHDKVFIY